MRPSMKRRIKPPNSFNISKRPVVFIKFVTIQNCNRICKGFVKKNIKPIKIS